MAENSHHQSTPLKGVSKWLNRLKWGKFTLLFLAGVGSYYLCYHYLAPNILTKNSDFMIKFSFLIDGALKPIAHLFPGEEDIWQTVIFSTERLLYCLGFITLIYGLRKSIAYFITELMKKTELPHTDEGSLASSIDEHIQSFITSGLQLVTPALTFIPALKLVAIGTGILAAMLHIMTTAQHEVYFYEYWIVIVPILIIALGGFAAHPTVRFSRKELSKKGVIGLSIFCFIAAFSISAWQLYLDVNDGIETFNAFCAIAGNCPSNLF